MKKIKLGLLGCGTVGSGIFLLLEKNKQKYEELLEASLVIEKIMVKDLMKERKGIPKNLLTTEAEDILSNPEIDIVVEVMGGIEEAEKYIEQAIKNGKDVVTANKDLMATKGHDLLLLGDKLGQELLFEASVAGALPVIDLIKNTLISNKITKVMGIINGTTNFILTKMFNENRSLSDVLNEAQELGYAESDPTADIEGLDAARKIAILASISFHSSVSFDDVYVEGITKIEIEDVAYAKQFNSTIKLLGIAKQIDNKIEVSVYPVLLANGHPLAKVDDVYNAVYMEGNAFGDLTIIGKGAGGLPTASAVVSDILSISKNLKAGISAEKNCSCYLTLPINPVAQTDNHFYIRTVVKDQTGVLAQIAKVFADNNVSIDSVIQKKLTDNRAELVLLTDKVREENFMKAKDSLELLEDVLKVQSILRSEKDN